jgi:hypothetical protein
VQQNAITGTVRYGTQVTGNATYQALTVQRLDSGRAIATATEPAELFDRIDRLQAIERGALVDLTRLVAERR